MTHEEFLAFKLEQHIVTGRIALRNWREVRDWDQREILRALHDTAVTLARRVLK
jgi:hypothetical protein